MNDADRAAKRGCTHFLPMHVPETPAATLRRLAALDAAEVDADSYGDSGAVTLLEKRCAGLLGTSAARFFIKGMMAQAAALTVYADDRGTRNVAVHRMSHINLDEGDAIERACGLRSIRLGTTMPFGVEDLRRITEPLAAVVVELPLRRAGFLLPPLAELRAISAWCRENKVPLHFDGARLWEAAAGYDMPLEALATLADSIYVSFYKGLGGLGGAMLAGPERLIDATAIWQQRYFGNLYTVHPYALSALDGLDRYLPRMPEFVARARELAAALRDMPGVMVNPAKPHAHAFQIIVPGDPADLTDRNRRFAEDHKVWLFNAFQPAPIAGHALAEINIGDGSDNWSVEQAAGWLRDFFSGGG
ncbi:threonine aldolase family protein [Stakelama marina]|uniref:Threonine aldolase n=1 Tax=Stakelama marina TaxID=2826939 RepID=A0A8T4IBH0_9SPHN|nr:beta-eliminating lyase-related protein [Stakelama marina]MBR0551910.1 threonine aldolase [Stakelama marina]